MTSKTYNKFGLMNPFEVEVTKRNIKGPNKSGEKSMDSGGVGCGEKSVFEKLQGRVTCTYQQCDKRIGIRVRGTCFDCSNLCRHLETHFPHHNKVKASNKKKTGKKLVNKSRALKVSPEAPAILAPRKECDFISSLDRPVLKDIANQPTSPKSISTCKLDYMVYSKRIFFLQLRLKFDLDSALTPVVVKIGLNFHTFFGRFPTRIKN